MLARRGKQRGDRGHNDDELCEPTGSVYSQHWAPPSIFHLSKTEIVTSNLALTPAGAIAQSDEGGGDSIPNPEH